MTFLAYVIFIGNAIFIGILVWFYSAQNKVKFVRISDWPGVHKFFTLPISLFCVLVLAGTFVMVTHSNNEIDKMWADASTEIRELPKPSSRGFVSAPPKKTICRKMALGEDRSTVRANYRCWDKQGEYFRPTWEEWDKIK